MSSLLVTSLSLLSLAAACGDNGGAGAIDASPAADADVVDAGSPDATPAPAPVTVWSHDGENGLAGLRVLFLDVDDTVIADLTTDGSGEATATVPYGAQALTVSADGNYVQLWQGLSEGTLENFVDGNYAPMDVIAPTHIETDGGYEVQTPCGGGSSNTPTVPMTFYRRGCTIGDAIVMWRYGTGAAQALHVTDRNIAGGSTIDLSGEVFTPMVERTITFENLVAADQTHLRIEVGYNDFRASGFSNGIGAAAGDHAITGALPNTPTASLVATVGQIVGGGARQVMRRGDFAATSFDPAGAWLPHLGAATYVDATRAIGWSQTGGDAGVSITAVRLGVSFDLPGDPHVGHDVYWDIVAPPGTSVRIPVLPANYADVDPAGANHRLVALARCSQRRKYRPPPPRRRTITTMSRMVVRDMSRTNAATVPAARLAKTQDPQRPRAPLLTRGRRAHRPWSAALTGSWSAVLTALEPA